MVQWSAIVSYFQDSPLLGWTNLVLAQPIGSPHIGSPEGGGLVIAFLVVTALLGLSIRWGAKWNWSVWRRCAVIFWVIWVLLYSTFFTNIGGIGSGIMAVSGLLGGPTGRRPGKPAVVLLLRHNVRLRVPAPRLRTAGHRLLPAPARSLRCVPRLLGRGDLHLVRDRQREDALAPREHHPPPHRGDRKAPRRGSRARRLEAGHFTRRALGAPGRTAIHSPALAYCLLRPWVRPR